MRRSLSVLALAVAVTSLMACPPGPKDDEIEVKVLTILASKHHTEVHPKLAEFAKQVQKKEPSLIGFKLHRTTAQPCKLGETKKFELPGGDPLEVTVNKE